MREEKNGGSAEEKSEPEPTMLEAGADIFAEYFRNRFPNLGEYEARYLPVIEMLAASPVSLPESLILEILGGRRARTLALPEELGPLFTVGPLSDGFPGNGEEGERFFSIASERESALRTWLRSPAAKEYALNERRGHRRLAERGLLLYRKHGPAGLPGATILSLPVHLVESGMSGSCAAFLADPRVRRRAAELGVSLPEEIGVLFRRRISGEKVESSSPSEALPTAALPADAACSL